ncbi:MAG TPA: D-alanyl-D-alanine carboxypeptidase [Candidatus Nanopelagicales bacterium]|nr:D-alanyl-D-alanine carboxypeptidase [Candidatus Nanopelagicales bacterium]
MIRRTLALAVAASVLVVAAPAYAATSPDPGTNDAVGAPRLGDRTAEAIATATADARIARLLPSRFLRPSPIAASTAKGALVVDPATGATLYSYNPGAALRGASTTKLATAVTTLRVLGTTTRFPTVVVDGRTSREIVLVAGGDPLLSSSQLLRLARSTAAVLATRVPAAPDPAVSPAPVPVSFRISVRVDDTRFPAPTLAPGWPSTYVPGVVSPVRALKRDLRHGSDTSKDAATYFAGQVSVALKALLVARTDLVPAAIYDGRLAAAAGAPEIARFAGNTSGAALNWMLKVSDNDVAEMLFRNNAVARGIAPTWAGARTNETRELAALGVDTRGWAVYDGSGVGRYDRLTVRGLVSLLRLAISPDHPELRPLKGWLPIGGVDGTLSARAGRFTTTPTVCARGEVFAKTGTLRDAIGLAGYATGSDGRPRVFAVMVARNPAYAPLTTRRAVDLLPTTLTGCW